MKKVEIATEKVLAAYNVLAGAKYSKLDDKDKIRIWRISRAMKPFAEKFNDDQKDAWEKMKPSGDFDSRQQRAQEYQAITRQKNFDASKLPMGPAEYAAFVREFNEYQRLVNESLEKFGKEVVSFEIEPITEDALCKLMDSNEWTMAQVMAVAEIVVE